MITYQFLVLLKPEATQPNVNRPGLLRLIYDHFERQDVEILDQAEFSGTLLGARQALNCIYPRLSVIAQTGERALTSAERNVLERETPGAMNLSADEACAVLALSGTELCTEGDFARVIKLGPGAYASHIVERNYVVLNHFFPEFRDRFYADGASVIALECQTTGLDLHQMREKLVGNIHPSRAEAGSLRASALAYSAKLGLGEVSVARNFFHISPGYIEAMYQLAFLFPEGGSFQERLVRHSEALSAKQLEACTDRAKLAQYFAESEQLQLREALHAMKRWINARPE